MPTRAVNLRISGIARSISDVMQRVALPMLVMTAASAATPDAQTLEEGKALYNAPGSCVACHMPDGNGLPNAIPPLRGSAWLNDPQRTIAISLRGLTGPITVNGQRYDSAMPPQMLFGDEEMAKIITYVNHAWGNNHPAVTAEQVARARKQLPPEPFSPETILEAFPFTGDLAEDNGTFAEEASRDLISDTEPVVVRTFMPGASPAAFAVALPGEQYYCWDAGECRLRYAWSQGGFITGNKRHWSGNGKAVATFTGVPYYRARSSLLGPEDFATLHGVKFEQPLYDTTQARDFPITIAGVQDQAPRFRGYRLIDGRPEFHYSLGAHAIHEWITTAAGANGIERHFRIDADGKDVVLQLTPDPKAILESSTGTITSDGTLKLDASAARQFVVTVRERTPAAEAGR